MYFDNEAIHNVHKYLNICTQLFQRVQSTSTDVITNDQSTARCEKKKTALTFFLLKKIIGLSLRLNDIVSALF